MVLAVDGITKMGPWVDAHVHLQAATWFKTAMFPRRTKLNRRRQTVAPASPRESSQSPNDPRFAPSVMEQAALLVQEMDAAGIDIGIVQAIDWDYTGEKINGTHWDHLLELKAVQEAFPGRFLLFCGIDPRRGKEGLALLERAVKELGVVGVGEFMPHWGFRPDDRALCYDLYAKCSELNLPLATNCSIIGSSHVSYYCDPIYFEQVAYDFPDMNICLTSMGIPHWVETAIGLATVKHNIYVDFADWQAPLWSDPIGHFLTIVRRLMDSGARRKAIFGSDWPVYAQTWTEQRWVQVLTERPKEYNIHFTDEELNLIFSENVQDFLDLNLPHDVGRRTFA
jgi:predicted TIM-barrel fold metal-dependent hydrolase